MRKINFELLKLQLLYLTVLLLVAMKTFVINNIEIQVFSSTAISILFLLFYNYKILNKSSVIKVTSDSKIIIALIIIYIAFININALIVEPQKAIFPLVKSIPIITFIFLIILFNIKPNLRDKIEVFSFWLLSISMILAFILFHLGYSNLYISINKIVSLVPNDEYVKQFGETRLQWMSTHKSRFAAFCIFSILFTVRAYIKNIYKVIIILICLINIFYSSSKISLYLVLFSILLLLFFKIILGKINTYLKGFFLVMILMLGFLGMVLAFHEIEQYMNSTEYITLGDRTYIWKYSIDQIKTHPEGIITYGIDEFFKVYERNIVLKSAHNIFLDEFLKNGIIGGIIFLMILLTILWKCRTDLTIFVFLCCLYIIGCFDIILEENMNYIFWYLVALLYTYVINEKLNNRRRL
ncbi:O-antigen ligase family protein [Anoxybacillus sp. FSL W8-1294]|uniref:O-antigen ligase family protein n=1 Tax=Anoxybacillus sp. FSL W8-1294 TaxID=2954655 RepID=UPI0030CE0849